MKELLKGMMCGGLNGFFGSGGGVVALPLFRGEGCSTKQAHATSVAFIFVLSLLTAFSYGLNGGLDFASAWEYIPWGAAGAVTGALLLRRISSVWLHRLFGALVVAASLRMLLS